MTFSPEQNAMLEAQLDKSHVITPTKGAFGPKGDYLEGWHVINELNRIFGFDGWSYTIELTRDALDKASDKDQWQAAYTCVCTLRVGEVTRQDVGFGSGFAKMIGDAVEGATKEAATDALKRAARTFGNQFGLALYDKSRANVVDASIPMIDVHDESHIFTLAQQADVTIQAICEWSNVSKIRELTKAKAESVIKKLELSLEQKQQKEAA